MEGLRNFTKVDNHCALEVGQWSEGFRPFQVRRPKLKGVCAEEVIREGPRGVDAESGGSGIPENVHQCGSYCGGEGGTTVG